MRNGSVYTYEFYNITSEWLFSQRIPSPLDNQSCFGHSLALKQDRLVIGAIGFRKYLMSTPLSYLN
jgi:hypothetical protein